MEFFGCRRSIWRIRGTPTGIGQPRFWDRAKYYGEQVRLAAALDSSEIIDDKLKR